MSIYDDLIKYEYADLQQLFLEDLLYKKGAGFTIESLENTLDELSESYSVQTLNSTSPNDSIFFMEVISLNDLTLISTDLGVTYQISSNIVDANGNIIDSNFTDYFILTNPFSSKKYVKILLTFEGFENTIIKVYQDDMLVDTLTPNPNVSYPISLQIGDWQSTDTSYPIIYTSFEYLYVVTDLNGQVINIYESTVDISVG